jgi:hypothetical protein
MISKTTEDYRLRANKGKVLDEKNKDIGIFNVRSWFTARESQAWAKTTPGFSDSS